MHNRFLDGISAAGLCFALAVLCPSPGRAQNKTLNAVFTPTAIQVDGKAEAAWGKAAPSDIAICMNQGLTAPLTDCKVSGTVQALWSGSVIYLFRSSRKTTDSSS